MSSVKGMFTPSSPSTFFIIILTPCLLEKKHDDLMEKYE